MTEQSQEVQQLDRKDLKIEAYKQKLAFEQEQNADLRIDLTLYAQEVERLNGEVQRLSDALKGETVSVEVEEAEATSDDAE